MLAGLLGNDAANESKLTLMDFGGYLGATYFQCRDFLFVLPQLRWCIVEQEKFVRRGRKLFEKDQLQFFFSIQKSIGIIQPNFVLFSSVCNTFGIDRSPENGDGNWGAVHNY